MTGLIINCLRLDTDVTDLTDRLAIQTATLQHDSSSLPNDNCEELLPPDANCDVVSCGGILLPTVPLSRKTHTLANQVICLKLNCLELDSLYHVAVLKVVLSQ